MQATLPASAPPFPARLEGRLEQPSRWLWLVKWLLVVPHYIVLAFLWIAFGLLSLVAFVALLFGFRYPRGIFDFNVGVLRWTWRVAFYAFGANGTDRYPPFTLADVPEYPARLEVAYPERQRHGLPLVGRWLLGVPQYVVAIVFAGGAGGIGWDAANHWEAPSGWFGLIDLLVFVAVVVLLFRGEYPRSIFDFVIGLNRWVLRVGAYAALMTTEYPPFRLDAGESEPGGLGVQPMPASTTATTPTTSTARASWGAGRVLAVILASLAVLGGLAALAGGGVALVFDQTQRDASGYVMTGATAYSTNTYALVSDSYRTGAAGDVVVARDMLGTVRVRTQSARPVFVGIGPAAAVESYLAGVRREVATRFDAARSDFRLRQGGAPAVPPTSKRFWVAQSVGSGVRTLHWSPSNGDYRIVVMNPNGSAGVNAELAIGARFPHLLWIGIGLLGGSALLLVLGGAGLYAAVRSPGRASTPH
jgi:Domain of unknown function (DUF4389)